MSPWVRVRVVGPTGSVDVALPLVRTVADLVEELVTSLLPRSPLASTQAWDLHRVGARAFDPSSPLAAARPVHGEVLHLSPAGSAPDAAVVVDDAITALAAGANGSGRWSAATASGVLAGGALILSAGIGVLALTFSGAGAGAGARAEVLAVLAAGLLVAAGWLRRDGGDLIALVALPLCTAGGLALALRAGSPGTGGILTDVTDVAAAAAATAVGACAAGLAIPSRWAWWAAPATAGASIAAGCAVAGSGAVTLEAAAAIAATCVVAIAGASAHLLSRTARWSSDAPTGATAAELHARGRTARALLGGATAGCAAAIALGATVLVLTGDRGGVTLGVVLGALVVVRARRSRFVAESATLLVAGAAPVGAALARLALADEGSGRAGGWAPAALALAVIALLVALGLLVVVRRATRGLGGAAARLARPRVLRVLDVLDALLALAVLPLLGWVLGLYALAADAGARW